MKDLADGTDVLYDPKLSYEENFNHGYRQRPNKSMATDHECRYRATSMSLYVDMEQVPWNRSFS